MSNNTEELIAKKITFEGQTYTVPTWVGWVARDADGEVYGYRHEPTIPEGDSSWSSRSNYYEDNFIKIAEGQNNCEDSLRKI